jgi:crotonobetainyl-CoA:carnitine CoA-transferase CaiB-like acyl-CoA transferase
VRRAHHAGGRRYTGQGHDSGRTRPEPAAGHPHIRASGFMQDVDYPGLRKPAPVARAAVRLSETPGEIATRPPTLGEHTDRVLAELGYDTATIAALRQSGII